MPSQPKRILLVRAGLEDLEAARQLVSDACEASGMDPEVTCERNLADATRRLQKHYDLIVADLDLPASRTDAVLPGDSRRLGMHLVDELRQKGRKVPAILVSATGTDAALGRDVERVKRASVVQDGADFDTVLTRECKRWLSGAPASDARLDVEICLRDSRRDCSYRVLARDGLEYDGPLNVDDTLLDLVQASRNIAHMSDQIWRYQFLDVGKRIKNHIFTNNPPFRDDFERARGYMQGVTHLATPPMRIRFVVENTLHPIALEALVDNQDKFWMLRAPMVRRISVPTARRAFMPSAAAPANCLIVMADAHGYWPALGHDLEPLRGLADEGQRLVELLTAKKAQGMPIGRIRTFPEDAADAAEMERSGSFAGKLESLLTSELWHFVHFIGHSEYDANGKQGYVALPRSRDTIDTISSERFARWLDRSSFVYLSSCESSEEDFVFEMASAQVPAVAGFRWKIDDAVAPEYALKFYDHLFHDPAEISFEDAFFRARCDLYESHPKHKVWAAPVLVVQTDD
jgi:CheY-like chemotaxis protein